MARELPSRKTIFTPAGRIRNAREFVEASTRSRSYIYAFIGKMSPWETRAPVNGISQSNPAVVTSYSHPFTEDQAVIISDVMGMSQINGYGGVPIRIQNVTEDTFELVGVDSTSFGTYSGGGWITSIEDADWPAPSNAAFEAAEAFRRSFYMKRIPAADMCFVVPKYVWTPGTNYAQTDYTDPQIFDKKFYVVNSVGRVYKCLSNNANTASTVEPTSTSLARFTTSDGYVWKYLYQLSTADRQRFETDDWLPVRIKEYDDGSDQWDIQQAARPGTLDAVVVIDGGQNFTSTGATFTIVGDGTGARVSIPAAGVDSSGRIIRVQVDDPGENYTWAEILISHPNGHGARFRAVISPLKGHGWNAVEELGGRRVFIDSAFDGDAGELAMTGSDFRQMGIVASPLSLTTGQPVIGQEYDLRETFELTNVNVKNPSDNEPFIVGQKITGITSGATAYVAGVGAGFIRVCEITGSFQTSETIDSATGTATLGTVTRPPVDKLSGSVIYLENRGPTYRTPTQTEKLRTVIEF